MSSFRRIALALAHEFSRTNAFTDRFVPAEHQREAETLRKARLIVNFGLLGSIFGLVYALFYLFIGHYWGAAIVLVCTLGLAAVGLSKIRNLTLSGNLQAAIMTCGFAGLSAVEGGVAGHAVGWLATVPISALVLANLRSGIVWLLLSLAGTATFSLLFALGVRVPVLYPARWAHLVTASGYVSLTLFAGILGFVIEVGRRDAYQRMVLALHNLAKANEGLALLNQEKTHILQVVAHDLKSPLQAVLGHAGLISEGFVDTPEEIKSSAAGIVSTARRMSGFINDLLNVDAIEEGRVELHLENLDLQTLVQRAVSHHEFAAQNKKITLQSEYAAQAISVRAGTGPALQVLDNLLSNAIKYSPPGGHVRVLTRQEDDFGLIEVEDSGPGISSDDQQKLFRKFTKLSARPTAGESSTGLGLSIAKTITESMGGCIGCRSEPGHGSIFFLQLPLASEPPASAVA